MESVFAHRSLARRWAVMERRLRMTNVTNEPTKTARRAVTHVSGIFVLAIGLTLPLACVHPVGRANDTEAPVLIELWCRGDDGLTLRFRDALETGFRNTSGFALVFGNERRAPRTLVVTIANHLSWKPVGENTEVSYTITFEGPNAEPFGRSVGSCREDDLLSCVHRAVSDAQRAARQFG